MPDFDTTPSWWHSLSNLTGWFEWEAIGAIGSVGALLLAIILASRDSRDRRAQAGSVIMAVMHPLASAINVLATQWETGQKLQHAPEVILQRVFATGVFDEMRAMMEEVSIKDLPTAAAIDAFIAARSALKNITIEGSRLAREKPSALPDWVPARINDLIAYHEQLAAEALRFVPRRYLIDEMTRGGPTQGRTRLPSIRVQLRAAMRWFAARTRSKKG